MGKYHSNHIDFVKTNCEKIGHFSRCSLSNPWLEMDNDAIAPCFSGKPAESRTTRFSSELCGTEVVSEICA